MLAMSRAIDGLKLPCQHALVDGNKAPQTTLDVTTIIKGDSLVTAISAASVLAKVQRDREMLELDKQYPGYGFAKHKGYGTAAHMEALQALGPCEIHRRSYAPVKALLKD